MNIKSYFTKSIFPVIIPVSLATIIALIPHFYLLESFNRLLCTTALSILILTTTFWFWGLTPEETTTLRNILNSIGKKMAHKGTTEI